MQRWCSGGKDEGEEEEEGGREGAGGGEDGRMDYVLRF